LGYYLAKAKYQKTYVVDYEKIFAEIGNNKDNAKKEKKESSSSNNRQVAFDSHINKRGMDIEKERDISMAMGTKSKNYNSPWLDPSTGQIEPEDYYQHENYIETQKFLESPDQYFNQKGESHTHNNNITNVNSKTKNRSKSNQHSGQNAKSNTNNMNQNANFSSNGNNINSGKNGSSEKDVSDLNNTLEEISDRENRI